MATAKQTELLKEGDEIAVDVFGSREVDMALPTRTKRRRQVDDYDYNDPFFESFEGEYDPVDIECNLENFFVYRGDLPENPKKIARKHHREKSKKELQHKLQASQQGDQDKDKAGNKDTKDGESRLSFEKLFTATSRNKYKKEPEFSHLIYWLFQLELDLLRDATMDVAPETPFLVMFSSDLGNCQANLQTVLSVLTKFDPHKYSETYAQMVGPVSQGEGAEYAEHMREQVEETYKAIVTELQEGSNYTNDGTLYRNYREEESVYIFVRFYVVYIKYYVALGNKNVNQLRNSASDYLMAAFPPLCRNDIKMKFYIRKMLEKIISVDTDYSLEEVLKGNFTKGLKPSAELNTEDLETTRGASAGASASASIPVADSSAAGPKKPARQKKGNRAGAASKSGSSAAAACEMDALLESRESEAPPGVPQTTGQSDEAVN